VCIAAGVNEFMRLPIATPGWKVFHTIFGLLFVLVGIVALAYPHRTFIEVAAIFSFFLLFKGVFDAFASLALRAVVDLWWIGLIVGAVEILLAFCAAGSFGRQSAVLGVA